MPKLHSNTKYIPYLYELRWWAQYEDGTEKFGMWTKAGVDKYTKPSMINRDRLLWMGIQAKPNQNHPENRREGRHGVKVMVKRPAEYWQRYEWVTASPICMGTTSHFSEMTVLPNYQGLTLVTRAEKITILLNGKLNVKPNNDKGIVIP